MCLFVVVFLFVFVLISNNEAYESIRLKSSQRSLQTMSSPENALPPPDSGSTSSSNGNGKEWIWNASYVKVSDDAYIYSRTHNLQLMNEHSHIPLLFIHGYTDSSTYYDYFLEKFSKLHDGIYDRYTIIEADVRGHGESQIYNASTTNWTIARLTLDIVEILQYNKVSKAIWIGMSMGGVIVIDGLIHHPTYVHSAVLISAGPYLSSISKLLLSETLNSLACVDHNFQFGTSSAQDYINVGLSETQAFKIKTDTYKLGTTAAKGIGNALFASNYSSFKIHQNVLIMSSYLDYIFTPSIILQLKAMCLGNITSYNNFSYGHSFLYYYTNDVISYIWQWLH